ncbi:Copper resistance protein D [Streptomyces venezuelae]|uniref:copper resistance CopC/CopD family protein n=1 Tax=Streptomyces gardneri TaxID=66892 RepID=UPI0006BC5881|nr:copper resistance protein CopC [Streptomyces gardneri]ALO09750.1 Copper resistance protein D [Streptomyces venezuelae]QPK46814.1 copper resistance protein CopC/CopD [Streptomyces gardneri]WRK38216.1 copper resistance protein CopC [Streptomyces venezuelae]CUM39817.1 Copper resistance protein D [Streptomyces venezuelae]
MTTTAPRLGTAVARLLILAAALLGTLLAGAAPASAHAALTGSDPRDGAVVATAPKEVNLTFSEQVAMSADSIRVLDPAGRRADTGEMRDLCSGSVVRYGVGLRAGLPDGTYTVAWQTVSADSHPIAGAFTFSIGAPSATSVALPEQNAGGGLVGGLYGIARYLSYASFAVLVGGGAFVLACWPRGAGVRPVQRTVVRAWLTLTVATLAMLLLRNPYTGSGELSDAFDLAGLKAVLETKTGAALTSRLLLLGAAALFVAVLFGSYARRTDPKERKDLAFGLGLGGTVVAAGIAGTWALAEHASTGIQPGIAMPVDILHLLAVAAWLGGLTVLLVALYRAPSVERSAVERFSKVAFGSVLVLAATGLYQSWRQVGSWSALTDTRYGQLLLVKIGLLAVLLGIAWVSRRWTQRLADPTPTEAGDEAEEAGTADDTRAEAESEAEEQSEEGMALVGAASEPGPETAAESHPDPERAAQLARQRAAVATARRKRERDADPERAGLRRSVLTEAAVAVVLLAVTTVLTSTEPGRTEEEAGRTGSAAGSAAVPDRPVDIRLPFDTGGVDGKGVVRLSLDPGRTGANALHLFVERPNGKPLDVPEVKVALTLKAKDVGPLPVAPDRIQTGHWSASGVQIPMPGEWTIQVTVRTSDIDQTTIDKNVKIG